MTHRWGFDLSMTAVRLMRREAGHWREMASENLEGGDMDQRLRALVEQIPEPRVVDIFLPRDQILYTDVKLNDTDKAVSEIEAAMEGRTPYALTDLEIDWEIGADNTASVAAIAKVTLSEAEAFADQCGLRVSRFSSLPDIDDFPRQPDFGIGAAGDDAPEAPGTEETDEAAFASSRRDEADESPAQPASVSPEDLVASDSDSDSAPVVRVEDVAPVMQVAEERAAPLDPGPALPRTAGAPRVRTDMSLPDGGGRAAASLMPPEPIDPYGKSEVAPARRLKGLGLGLAAILTAGIALVVWSIFPETPADPETSANLREEPAVATAPPVLSETPPAAQTDFASGPSAPEIVEEVRVAFSPLDQGPVSKLATLLDIPSVQSGIRPDPLLPPDTPAEAWTAAPAVLASLETVPDESGLLFDKPVPPVTRPGNVGLPGVQGFEAGTAPASDTAPDYVPPAPPPVIAESDVPDASVTEDTSEITSAPIEPDADQVAEAPESTEPDVEIAALDEAIPETPEVPLTAPEALAEEESAADQADVPTSTELATPEPTEDAPVLPTATELAAGLTDTAPPARPSDFALELERRAFGGRTVVELSEIRPPGRPASAQTVAEAERGTSQPTALAVSVSPDPAARPDDMSAIIARAIAVQRERAIAALPTANTTDAVRAALGEETPEEAATNPRNTPRLAIPSSADVARQATIEDAIRLNRLNLVGVFGAPADRRALVRLPTGRYVKVKIGDQVDGGTIAAITDDALQYRKGGRVFQLEMPQG